MFTEAQYDYAVSKFPGLRIDDSGTYWLRDDSEFGPDDLAGRSSPTARAWFVWDGLRMPGSETTLHAYPVVTHRD